MWMLSNVWPKSCTAKALLLKEPDSNSCFKCALFLKVSVKKSVGDRLTPSKFEFVRVDFLNITPFGIFDITVKSTPTSSVCRKLVWSKTALDRLTPDKSASKNEVEARFAPDRLLFLVFVKSAFIKSANLRFVSSRFVFLKLAYHKDDLDRSFPDKSSPSNTVFWKFFSDKVMLGRLVSVRSAPFSMVSVRSLPERSIPWSIVPVRSLPFRSTPSRFASVRSAPFSIVPVRSLPERSTSWSIAPVRSLPFRSTPSRFASVRSLPINIISFRSISAQTELSTQLRFALVKIVFSRLVLVSIVQVRSLSERSTPARFASVRSAPFSIVPVRSLPERSTPVRLASVRSASVNIVPVRSL